MHKTLANVKKFDVMRIEYEGECEIRTIASLRFCEKHLTMRAISEGHSKNGSRTGNKVCGTGNEFEKFINSALSY